MTDLSIGIVLAIGAAFAIGCANILIRLGSEEGRTYDAVIVVLICNVLIIVPTTLILHFPEYDITRNSLIAFIGAGITGTLLGRTFYYAGIKRIGASRTSPIITSNTLYAALLAIFLLNEDPTQLQLLGILLVVLGVVLITYETAGESDTESSIRGSWIAISIPVLGSLFYALEPIFARFGFTQGTDPFIGLSIKTVTATCGFLLYLSWRQDLPSLSVINQRKFQYYIAAGVANTVFLILYYVALGLAPVTVVAPLKSSNPLVVILLSILFLPKRLEKITSKLLIGACTVILGISFITIYS